MTAVRSQPCSACPYRCDVPSGVWAHEEYEKLRPYDNVTGEQPFGGFACHATPEHFCHGWAAVHTRRGHAFDLLALRVAGSPDIPVSDVPLFDSGSEAADWGQLRLDNPDEASRSVQQRLMRKYPRLRGE